MFFGTMQTKKYQMLKDMLARAIVLKTKVGISNIDFVESRITNIALNSETADCIISNCAINLVPAEEKHLVFSEMFRVLKPGGRVAISDVLARKPLPEGFRASVAAYVGCIAGAGLVTDYERYLVSAGFEASHATISRVGLICLV
jgi:arsenite methyltransferase